MSFKTYMKDEGGKLMELPLIAKQLGTTTVGSTKEPIYLKNGLPETCNDLNMRIVNLIYPVGSIYLSVNSANPQTLFGGTWEQLKDRFLLGAGDGYSAGSVGGEATHKLTTNEMPSHKHDNTISVSASQAEHCHALQSSDNYSTNCNGLARGGTRDSGGQYQVGGVANNNGDEFYITNSGDGNTSKSKSRHNSKFINKQCLSRWRFGT